MDENEFGFPEEVIEAYTCGDCWALAIAVSRLTKFPVVTASIDNDWVHAAVLLPEDRVLDIQGVHTVEQWLDRWLDGMNGEDHWAREWRLSDFVRQCNREQSLQYDEPVGDWAEKVLDAYTAKV